MSSNWSLDMAWAVGTGFNVLAGLLGLVPAAAFLAARICLPAVELGCEAVPVRPLAPHNNDLAVGRLGVAALDPVA